VSDFLEGAQAMSKPQVSEYGVKRQELLAKEFRGEAISPAEREALKEAEAAMAQADSVESVMAHAMSDLEFGAGDNHAGQYMRRDGHIYNIDYARGNAPGEAEMREVRPGEVETFATLKAVMFDHPHARNENIPENLVEQLMNRDLDAEEQQLRDAGMIGDPEFFDMASQRMSEHETDFKTIKFEVKNGTVRWTGQEPPSPN